MDIEQQRKKKARKGVLKAVAVAAMIATFAARMLPLNPAPDWYSATFGQALLCCAVIASLAILAANRLATDDSRRRSPDHAPAVTFACFGFLALIPFLFVFDSSARAAAEKSNTLFSITFYIVFTLITLVASLIVTTEQRKDAEKKTAELSDRLCVNACAFIILSMLVLFLAFGFNLKGL